MGCLYKVIGPTGKLYFGITRHSMEWRKAEHFKSVRLGLGWGKRKGPPPRSVLHRAMLKHGFENFRFELVKEADSWKKLCSMEIEAIAKYKTRAPLGYNSSDGGEGVVGFEITDEYRNKLSIGIKAAFEDPEMRARHKAGCLRKSRRKLISEKLKLWNSDPANAEARKRNYQKGSATRKAANERKLMVLRCAACKKEFSVMPCKAHRKYCSPKCAAAGMVTGATLKCVACGKEFHAKKSDIEKRRRKYCSDTCKNSHMTGKVLNEYRGDESVTVSCHGCEAEFTVPPWKAKRFARLFCTRECYVENWHLVHP